MILRHNLTAKYAVSFIFQKTDIAQHALEALSRSKIKNVKIVGRRGPLQVNY
jgi:hypothetical protein